jgi:hypothetical protein
VKKPLDQMNPAELSGFVASHLDTDEGLKKIAKKCGGDFASQKNIVRVMQAIKFYFSGQEGEPAKVEVETVEEPTSDVTADNKTVEERAGENEEEDFEE